VGVYLATLCGLHAMIQIRYSLLVFYLVRSRCSCGGFLVGHWYGTVVLRWCYGGGVWWYVRRLSWASEKYAIFSPVWKVPSIRFIVGSAGGPLGHVYLKGGMEVDGGRFFRLDEGKQLLLVGVHVLCQVALVS